MGTKLVIVESPAKARTINKILGADFVVKASMGHVRDLPANRFGVDLDKDFQPQYVPVSSRKKVIDELRKAAKGADAVYLAPDPDREGEAIAWHLQELLAESVPADRFYRVFYNEITKKAVLDAFANPGTIDVRKVDSQQARRILDRIVGYKVSPLLWQRVKKGLSAGRVQSVALRLLCEREQAIQAFVPEEYWLIGARVRKQAAPLTPFDLRLARMDGKKAVVNSAEVAERVLADLKERQLRVAKITTRETRKRPSPPYITSTLQQGASSQCGYSPDRTMRIAQRLYEGVDLDEGAVGLITYMRTDSFRISPVALEPCRAFIEEKYGRDYLPERPNVYRSRKGAQEAHEAIRPTDVQRTPESLIGKLPADQHKLYALIWKRFVASQMEPARISQRGVEVDSLPQDGVAYLLRASSSQVVFPGYMRVSGMEKPKQKGEEPENQSKDLPDLAEGEPLDLLEWLSERKETQPPARFSEASLIRVLEEAGVGRPSTYAQTLGTLRKRGYVEREKRTMLPTELGLEVNTFLVSNLGSLFEVTFTANMEELLDEIERGEIGRTEMLNRFYKKFSEWIGGVEKLEVDSEPVLRILAELEKVRDWAPAVKRGKRTFSDEKFVASLRKQLVERDKKLSPRQWSALLNLAYRYREQIPEIEQTIEQSGGAEILAQARTNEPSPVTVRKLDLLATVSFDPPAERNGKPRDDAAFVASLRDWVNDGRALTPAQARALDRVLMKYAKQIDGFEALREELGLEAQTGETPTPELVALLAELEKVTDWAPPVKRGKREWSDKEFFESVQRQLANKGGLSPRQTALLRKMVKKYKRGGSAEPAHEG